MANEGLLLAGSVKFGKTVGSNIWYPAGETDKLEIQPQSDTKSMTSKAEGSYGQSVNAVALPKEIKISVVLKEVNRKNIVRAFLGTDTDVNVAAGSSSDDFTLEHGSELALPHKKITAVAIKATFASLVTGIVVNNNALNWQAVNGGIAGNDITVALVDPGANDSALSIVVTDKAIVINLATDSGGVITSTALEVLTAAMADNNVTALINVTNKDTSNGSGLLTANAATKLTSGSAGFVEGTDYLVNKRDGIIIIPETSTIPDESVQPIIYTYAAYKGFKVDGATKPSITVPIKLNGVNLAKDNTPVEVMIHKVMLSPSKGVDLMSSDYVTLEFEGVAQLVEGEVSPFSYTEIEV